MNFRVQTLTLFLLPQIHLLHKGVSEFNFNLAKVSAMAALQRGYGRGKKTIG